MLRRLGIQSFALGAILAWLALPAAAAPILTVTPSSIALSPTQTVLTFDVDPNDTPLSAVVLNLSSLASGLVLLSIQTLDAEFITSGPALVGSDYQAGFVGTFNVDRSSPFTVGTLTVEGLTAGTPLVASGNYSDASFIDIFFGPSSVAIVAVPEPGSAGLVSLGLLALAARRRNRG